MPVYSLGEKPYDGLCWESTPYLYPFLDRREGGQARKAGRTVYGLCSAWNHATAPYLPMTEHEHARSSQYARAIKNRMARLGFTYGHDYKELSNGSLWPLARS